MHNGGHATTVLNVYVCVNACNRAILRVQWTERPLAHLASISGEENRREAIQLSLYTIAFFNIHIPSRTGRACLQQQSYPPVVLLHTYRTPPPVLPSLRSLSRRLAIAGVGPGLLASSVDASPHWERKKRRRTHCLHVHRIGYGISRRRMKVLDS